MADTGVETFLREGQAFASRHAELPGATMGGFAWGLLRAVSECPDCPGVYRVPQDQEWLVLVCGNCHGTWTRDPTIDPFAPAPAKPRRSRKGKADGQTH